MNSILLYIKYKLFVLKKNFKDIKLKLKTFWVLYCAVVLGFLIVYFFTLNYVSLLVSELMFVVLIVLTLYMDYNSGKWREWSRNMYKNKINTIDKTIVVGDNNGTMAKTGEQIEG